jgi:hypothetical protein
MYGGYDTDYDNEKETLLERVNRLESLYKNAKDDKLVQQVLGVEGWKKELVKAVEEIKTKNDIIEKLLEENKKVNDRLIKLEMKMPNLFSNNELISILLLQLQLQHIKFLLFLFFSLFFFAL